MISSTETAVVSVITAVDSAQNFITDSANSLYAQVLPSGWDWQWCVQIDGDDEMPDLGAAGDRRVTVQRNGGRAGQAATRNLALTRARGSIVVNLDADSLFLKGALRSIVDCFAANPSIAWVSAGNVKVDLELCEIRGFVPTELSGRRVPKGTLETLWRPAEGQVPIIPHTVSYRTDVVRRIGGWMALPRSEDTGLAMTVSHLHDGFILNRPTIRNRSWNGQVTARPWLGNESYAKLAGYELIRQRLESISRNGGIL